MPVGDVLSKMLLGRAFASEKGRIKLFGKMDWALMPAKAMAENFQSIAEDNGEEYLYKLGFEAGKSAADEMVKYMGLEAKGGWGTQQAIIKLLDFIGFGQVQFVKSDIDKKGQHHLIVHVKNNPLIEHAKKMYGKKSKVCYWFMGVYAAHGEAELGAKNIVLKENRCLCKGSPYCEWESKWP